LTNTWVTCIGAKDVEMAEDIVTRLRNHCDASHIPGLPCDWLGTKCFNCESADEIERLRTQVRALETEVTRLERLATNG
jgi:hypothetical protein